MPPLVGALSRDDVAVVALAGDVGVDDVVVVDVGVVDDDVS